MWRNTHRPTGSHPWCGDSGGACVWLCWHLNFYLVVKNLYSTPSRSILRGAPNPGQAEKNSLEKVVELRTGTVWEMP